MAFTPLAEPPPFSGTIFIDPDIITSADPTAYESMTYAGQGTRIMFDRRVNNWVTVQAHLFNAVYAGGMTIEIQVNPEFGDSSAAKTQAEHYAPAIGRLPRALREDVQTVWIHQGVQPFGGGNNNLLIHVGQGALYEVDGILEETFVHEASHTSLDAAHAASSGWLAAQSSDPEYISTYARDNPTREDIAESFLPWLAVRHRSSRITQGLSDTITATIPNRLAYFDAQGFDLSPISPATGVGPDPGLAPSEFALLPNYPNPFNPGTTIAFRLPRAERVTIRVLNLLGQTVETLLSESLPAGTHRIEWTAEGVPGGVYFCAMKAGSFSSAMKLLLIK